MLCEKRRTLIQGKIVILGTIFLCQLFYACEDKGLKEQLNEVRTRIITGEYDGNYPDANIENVILFLNNPTKYFHKVQNIQDIFRYIRSYEEYLRKFKGLRGLYIEIFLRTHFRRVGFKKASILTFLLLECPSGVDGELLADHYAHLFNDTPDIFMRELINRMDWKEVVDRIGSGNWPELKSGLNKLGDSKFEKELKEYVFAKRKIAINQ